MSGCTLDMEGMWLTTEAVATTWLLALATGTGWLERGWERPTLPCLRARAGIQAVSAHLRASLALFSDYGPLPDSYHRRKKIKIVPLLPVLVGGHAGRSLSYLPMVDILKVAVLMVLPCPGPGVEEAMKQWPRAGMYMERESQIRRPTQQLQQRVEFNGHSKGYRTLFSAQS